MMDQKTFTAESGNHTEQDTRVVSDHTPTPWHIRSVNKNSNRASAGNVHVSAVGDMGTALATCQGGFAATRLANAAFIVRAVNSHDVLVKALEQIIQYGDSSTDPGILWAARAALNSVREASSTSDPSLHASSLNNSSVSS